MIYGLAGTALNAAYGIGGTAISAAYALDGTSAWIADDGSPNWANVKWVPIGDSLSDFKASGGDWKYQKIIKSLIPEIGIVNYYTLNGVEKSFATGGNGYWRSKGTGNRFYDVAQYVPQDTDVVTIFGSINDRPYRSNLSSPTSTFYPLTKFSNLQGITSDSTGVIEWIADPHLDTVADGTVAGYVNDTISRIHTAAPNAKVVIIPGLNYIIDGGSNNKFARYVYFTMQAIVDAWRRNVQGADEWLAIENWYLKETFTHSIVDGKHRYTINGNSNTAPKSDVWEAVVDTAQLDYWWSGHIGENFDSRKLAPETGGIPSAFAQQYLADAAYYVENPSGNASYGHWNSTFHERYFARKFAHVLLKAFGWPATMLPTDLRYVDANGVPTDTNFNETYFSNE